MDNNSSSSRRGIAMAIAMVGWLGPVVLIPRDMPGGRFLQGVGVVIWCAVALSVFGRRVPATQRVDRSTRGR